MQAKNLCDLFGTVYGILTCLWVGFSQPIGNTQEGFLEHLAPEWIASDCIKTPRSLDTSL